MPCHCNNVEMLTCSVSVILPHRARPLHYRSFGQEEVEEVEQKVAEAEHSRSYARQFFTKFCTPVFLEAFVLTFLAG